MNFKRIFAALFLGFLFAFGTLLVICPQVVRGTNVQRINFLAINSAVTTFTTQSLPFNINGIWEDSSGNTCSDCTYLVNLQSQGSNVFFLSAWYQTDPSCPAAVGTEMMNIDIGPNGSSLNDAPGYTNMALCTRASNPIVADCGQPALWYTTYNITVSQDSISGAYLGQYWTWDTSSSGAISNCSIEYNYSQPFTLTPVFNTTSVSFTSSSSQQSTGPNNPSLAQSSTSQTSTKSTTSTSTTSTAGKSGPLGIEILVVAAVLVALIATSVFFLRKRP